MMNKRIKYIAFVSLILLIGGLIFLFRNSMAAPLINDVEVDVNTELLYYLNVSYDGVDRQGAVSNSTTTSEVKGGNIYVTDKIPDGLTFTGFVTTNNNSIGAVERGTTNACSGYVINDTNESGNTGEWRNNNTEFVYRGLHYNASTREVTFTVKGLNAGCELTVGIKTQTPGSIDDPNTTVVETRRDFYNFATAVEESLTTLSNTVHVYMGRKNETLYNVTYEYTGTIPSGAPSVPNSSSYAENTKVGVAPNAVLEGYTFSGWTTTDVTVSDSSFTMPASNVTFRGSFTEADSYKVTYQINGTMPNGYILPSEKEYYPGKNVMVDILKDGDVIGGYRFMGWTTNDVTVSTDNDFVMPNKNVTFTGTFGEIKYKVSYAFFEDPLPPNSDSLLPSAAYYNPGDIITLGTVTEPNGYKFLGWYHEDNFEMPAEDIVIYGEWKQVSGTFEPTITKTIVNPKDIYGAGDIVTFNIKVTNTANFAIKNVVIEEKPENAKFIAGTGYTLLTNHFANIASIAAGASVELKATYEIGSNEIGNIENVVEIVGALADNNYELADKDYIAKAYLSVPSRLKVCKVVNGQYRDNSFQVKISNATFETWLSLKANECKTMYINAGTYKVQEIVPQEYSLTSVTGAITSNNSNVVIGSDEYTITFTNEFVKKGFMHSYGRVENKIEGEEEPVPQEPTNATFDIGGTVNAKIKTMVAGTSKTKENDDSIVKKIMWSDTLPSGFTATAENTLSTNESEKPIYTWYDSTSNIVYCYTEADNIYLNADSGYMFRGFKAATEMPIIERVDTSNVTDMQRMFNQDSALTRLDVSHFDTSNVTTMVSMFYNCSNLTELDVSNFATGNVKSFQMTFMQCKKLTTLDVSHFDTSNVTDIGQMFRECIGLTSLDLSSFDTSKVTAMNSTFNGCTNLVTIYVSNKFVTTKAGSNTNMFLNDTKLVGGNGTTYNSSNTGLTYARIDKAGSPGYFTEKS